MYEYRDCIEINAPQEKAWEVLSDVERWPQWAPTFDRVARVGGEGGAGSVYRIEQPRLPVAHMKVDVWRPGEGFTWSSRKPLLRTTGLHWIEPTGARTCRVSLAFRFEGPMAAVAWPFVRKLVREYVGSEARALKVRAESA